LLERLLGRHAGRDFGIAYVPDFVALGDVVRGFQEPQFLLIGSDDEESRAQAAALFRRILAPGTPIQHLSTRGAELAKVAANVFLCTKISFGNFLAQLADRLGGADLDAIASTLALDPRIGSGFLRAGSPYGGTCLPRDVDAFVALARSVDLDAPLTNAVREVNTAQYDLIERHVLASNPRCVAILGLSFKPGTSVTIGSPAFELVRRLTRRSVSVAAYDPAAQARDSARATFGDAITCRDSITECVADAEVVLVCNSDPAFRGLATKVAPDRQIIDPWGCVRGTHPGLVRIGRDHALAASPPASRRRKSQLHAVR
jgi:UDPglucose 6-dehydrogenase